MVWCWNFYQSCLGTAERVFTFRPLSSHWLSTYLPDARCGQGPAPGGRAVAGSEVGEGSFAPRLQGLEHRGSCTTGGTSADEAQGGVGRGPRAAVPTAPGTAGVAARASMAAPPRPVTSVLPVPPVGPASSEPPARSPGLFELLQRRREKMLRTK